MNDLAEKAKALKRLSEAVLAAEKAYAQGKPEACKKIEEAVRLAEQFDWQGFLAVLKHSSEQERNKRETALQSRREKLLQAARAAGEPFDPHSRAIRVGIFRIELEGDAVQISLGGVAIERTKEADGEKLFRRLRELRQQLEQGQFSREAFFKQVQTAYLTCRRHGSGDEFVSIRDLHREMVLERARTNEAFRKRPEPKNVPAYPLHQFIFDLARFIQKGVGLGDERLVTTTPSMRESANTVFIPNLEHPLGNEEPAARLAIKRNI